MKAEDLFEYYEKQPKNLQKICNKWLEIQDNKGLNYKDCENFLKEVEKIGYTFEYGLSVEPFNLKIK